VNSRVKKSKKTGGSTHVAYVSTSIKILRKKTSQDEQDQQVT